MSFAVIDDSIGLRGYDAERQFSSASVSKALLLAAELRRLDSEHLPLEGEAKDLVEPMIVYSDNRAADAIYAEVGDEGLEEVTRHAGMRNFEPTPGFWGGDRITAADMARFFYRLDQNLPGRDRAYAKGLLAGSAPVERWGIPHAVDHGSATSPPAMGAASRRSRASLNGCWRSLRPAAGGGRPSRRGLGTEARQPLRRRIGIRVESRAGPVRLSGS